MITVNVVLKHQNTNNLNDILLQVSGETFAEISKNVNKFVKDYNAKQRSHVPPESVIMDWYLADKEEICGIPHAVDYALEALVDDDEED